MSTTFTIPLTTLPVGTINLGPASPADTESSVVLTIDRTVSGGLNSLTTASSITISVQQSNDGGNTWQTVIDGDILGGSTIDRHTGLPYTDSLLSVDLFPGTSRQLRASVVVAGTSIAVAGSLVSQ